MLKLDEAREALTSKTEEQIETETAWKWASYSIVCYQLSTDSKELGVKVAWILRGEDNRHEALEHASLAENEGKLVGTIQKEIEIYRSKAMELEV